MNLPKTALLVGATAIVISTVAKSKKKEVLSENQEPIVVSDAKEEDHKKVVQGYKRLIKI